MLSYLPSRIDKLRVLHINQLRGDLLDLVMDELSLNFSPQGAGYSDPATGSDAPGVSE